MPHERTGERPLADVQSGLGPFVAVYLVTIHGWNPAGIGLVMTIAGLATIVAQTPAGAAIDRTRRKRAWIIGAAALVSVAAVVVTLAPTFPVVTMTLVVSGMAAAVFPPALAAIALGLVGPERFTYRMGRVQAFNHGGNVVAALVAGAVGYLLTSRAVFWLIGLLGLGAVLAACSIRGRLIDNDLARGFRPHAEPGERPSAWRALFTLSDNAFYLLSVQVLDGVGAGIFDALFPLVIADLTRGTGRSRCSPSPSPRPPNEGAFRTTSNRASVVPCLVVGRPACSACG
ncbi:MFS transporter [Actinoallomurus sp. NPDC052274]|uniref:MFS transporter n=1 Tax=Actinoallomurus sp. NPDC052274 TaxID=3155420 RepID=UPI00342B402A